MKQVLEDLVEMVEMSYGDDPDPGEDPELIAIYRKARKALKFEARMEREYGYEKYDRENVRAKDLKVGDVIRVDVGNYGGTNEEFVTILGVAEGKTVFDDDRIEVNVGVSEGNNMVTTFESDQYTDKYTLKRPVQKPLSESKT